jgi:hypothetical protein
MENDDRFKRCQDFLNKYYFPTSARLQTFVLDEIVIALKEIGELNGKDKLRDVPRDVPGPDEPDHD